MSMKVERSSVSDVRLKIGKLMDVHFFNLPIPVHVLIFKIFIINLMISLTYIIIFIFNGFHRGKEEKTC